MTKLSDYKKHAGSIALQLSKETDDAISNQLAKAEALVATVQAAWTLSKQNLAAVTEYDPFEQIS